MPAVVSASALHLPVLARPRTRGECAGGPRPCPWTSCRYHLGRERGGNLPAGAPTCTLDEADRGGATLEEIAGALGRTRERIRQIEKAAIGHLAGKMKRRGLLTAAEAAAAPETVRRVLHRGLVG